MQDNPGKNGMIWFLGIVDNIEDPMQLGRVKVRVINEHDNVVETDDLPWSLVLAPTTSAAYLGLGTSPLGLQVGSRVIGFYLDDDKKTKPVILGTMPFIKDGNTADHSVAAQARGTALQKDYLEYEPKSAYAAEYPHNKTISTTSGHLIEVDDTPKSERIHVYHKSGSYIEMFPDGRIVFKSMKDNINISTEDQQIISDTGNVFLTAKQDARLYGEGDASVRAEGDVGVIAGGNAIVYGNSVEISGSSIKIEAGDINLEGSITLVGDVNVRGSLKVNGRPVDLK
jgi:hypothetical protein